MSADKKTAKEKLPEPGKGNTRNRNQEEFDEKSRETKGREIKERKAKKVNYIVKDLPIY